MPHRRYESIKPSTMTAKVGIDKPAKEYVIRRSKRLPKWLWFTIACSLGIRMNSNDRSIVAAILYSLTLLSALVFVSSTVIYVVSSAVHSHAQSSPFESWSNHSQSAVSKDSDMTEGCIMVALTVFWCLLGLYAQGLAYRLYSSAKFIDMVRLHAKTVLKVNAAFVFFLLITTFVAVNNLQAYYVWYAGHTTCTSIGVTRILCRVRFISQCTFSIFSVLWNTLVGVVLLSVCRTNTMGIRRFIQDLEKEAQIYERQRFGPGTPASDLMWLVDNDADQSSEGEGEEPVKVSHRKRYSTAVNVPVPEDEPDGGCVGGTVGQVPSPRPRNANEERSQRTILEMLAVPPDPSLCASTTSLLSEDHKERDKELLQPMSNAVILNRYWKLSCSTRISSLTFQRWTTCVTNLCLAWVAIGLVQWLSSTPQTIQVIQVAIPVLILPLLSAAYAEVNVEGKRLLKCICPMEERLAALYFMSQSPPQMTVFGVTITYAALGTAAAGLLLALASRVVLKQLGGTNV